VISVHILCSDDCFTTTIMPQPTEITQFIFGQPLSFEQAVQSAKARTVAGLAGESLQWSRYRGRDCRLTRTLGEATFQLGHAFPPVHPLAELRRPSWINAAIRGKSAPESSSSSERDMRRRQFGCASVVPGRFACSPSATTSSS